MKYKEYTDDELRRDALLILTQHLGHTNTLRFLSLYKSDNIDYMEIQEKLFEGLNAKEVYENAAEFWKKRK